MHPDFIGVAAVPPDHRWHRFAAKVMLAGHALIAVHTTEGIPAHAHPLADLQVFGMASQR